MILVVWSSIRWVGASEMDSARMGTSDSARDNASIYQSGTESSPASRRSYSSSNASAHESTWSGDVGRVIASTSAVGGTSSIGGCTDGTDVGAPADGAAAARDCIKSVSKSS